VQRQHIGNAYLQIGGHLHAERSLRAALALAERTGNHSLTAETRHWLSWALAGQGALEKAIAMGDHAVQTALALGSPRLEARSRSYLAAALALAGDLERADREARRAAEAAQDVPPVRAHALAVLAQTLLESKLPEDALEHAEEAMRLLESLGGIEEGESLVRVMHAEALAAVGRMDDAKASIARARDRLLDRAQKISDPRMRQSFLTNVAENARTMKRARQWLGGSSPS
jgi:tetratricopeptide (TPR) repeat protein